MNKVIRIKNTQYTTISNAFLRNEKLSLKAKGLLAIILSLPETWDFSVRGICSVVKEGATAVYSAIDELKQGNYCTVTVNRGEKGKIIGNDYTFYEDPYLDNPHAENPNVDNQAQINTKKNKDNKIEKNKEEIKELKERFARFVSLYKKAGGKVRGVDTEFDAFSKRHKDWAEVIPYLEMALQRETKERNQAKVNKTFYPEMKMLKTYLGKQRAWELFVTIGEPIKKEEYTPQCDLTLQWNDYYNCYLYTGYWNGYIPDGYKDEDRPNGASVTLNNGRGIVVWNSNLKRWEKQ